MKILFLGITPAILVCVFVSKMDLNEIEDEYRKNLDVAEKKFIEDIKLGLDIKKVEEDYRSFTEKARETYNSKLSYFLKNNKENLQSKKISKKEQDKVFKVNTDSYDLNFFERINRKISLFFFKIGFHLRNSFKKNTPSSVLYTYYILKIKSSRMIELILIPIKSAIEFISDLVFRIKSKFKEIFHTKS